MEEFKFLQKKTNRETIDTDLITPQWKKKFIEENYNRIVETFLNHDMSLYQNFIKLLNLLLRFPFYIFRLHFLLFHMLLLSLLKLKHLLFPCNQKNMGFGLVGLLGLLEFLIFFIFLFFFYGFLFLKLFFY